LPARVLFSSFDTAAKGVTWDFYCSVFGKMVDPKSLHATEELLSRTEGEQAAAKARDRFFAGSFTALRPLRLPIMHGEQTHQAGAWQEELAQARQAMDSLGAAYRDAVAAYDKADTRMIEARQARAVLSTGASLEADKFEARYASTTDASRLRDAALAEMGRLRNRMETFEDAAGRRLRADLMMLGDPATVRRIEGAEQMQRDSRQLLPIVAQVANLHASVLELRNDNATLVALLGHVSSQSRNETLIREILDYVGRVRGKMSELKTAFERFDYPFDHAAGAMTVSQYLIKVVPLADDIGAVYEAANETVGKLLDMYARAINRLCVIAEAIEAERGYQPLPAPPEAGQ